MLRFGLSFPSIKKVLQPPCLATVEQIRTTFVLKRRWPPMLDDLRKAPKPLKTKNYIYDLVEHKDSSKKPDLKLILTSYVDGVGMKNDVVTVRPHFGRNKLLLPGLAVYASPENLEKLKKTLAESSESTATLSHSSNFAEMTRRDLSSWIVRVLVSQETPWTIEKWHVRSSFRRCGFWVPDYAITMPDREISGPNLDLDGKVFLVTVKINNLETTPVRCMIRYLSSNPELRMPPEEYAKFRNPPYEPVFEEEREAINKLPLPAYCIPKGA